MPPSLRHNQNHPLNIWPNQTDFFVFQSMEFIQPGVIRGQIDYSSDVQSGSLLIKQAISVPSQAFTLSHADVKAATDRSMPAKLHTMLFYVHKSLRYQHSDGWSRAPTLSHNEQNCLPSGTPATMFRVPLLEQVIDHMP